MHLCDYFFVIMKHQLIAISFLFFVISLPLVSQDIVINELMSSNSTTIQDEDGDFEDWFELYNNGTIPVNLENYAITDDTDNLRKWIFPSITIQPNGFILVFASDKNKKGSNLHTNFKLKASGEALILSDNQGTVIDNIAPVSLSTDVSYGRNPDASSNLMHLDIATPGWSNNGSNNLDFSHPGGFYSSAINLEITSGINQNDIIYYTKDGSMPDRNSLVYTSPIAIYDRTSEPNVLCMIPTSPDFSTPGDLIFKGTVIKAISYNNGLPSSKVYTHSYFIHPESFARYDYPVISIAVDTFHLFNKDTGIYVPGKYFDPKDRGWTGNYFQRGKDWEREINVEFFETNGELAFSQKAGLRIHGGGTRSRQQKSLRLYARKDDYGEQYFNHQLFPQKEKNKYKRFVLRSTYGCWSNTVFKDAITSSFAIDVGIEAQYSRPAIVFINGEYWGIHTMANTTLPKCSILMKTGSIYYLKWE